MSVICATTTLSIAGVKNINLGFQPTSVELLVGSKFQATDAVNHTSNGDCDGTRQHVISTFSDDIGGMTVNSSSKFVSHWERVGGNMAEVLSANFNSWTSTGIKINVVIPNIGYQVIIRARN